jgi:hypothetical protein
VHPVYLPSPRYSATAPVPAGGSGLVLRRVARGGIQWTPSADCSLSLMPTRADRADQESRTRLPDLDNHRLPTLLHRGVDWHTPPAPSQAAHHAARPMTPGLGLHAQPTVSRTDHADDLVRGTVITAAGMLIMRSCR